MAKKGQKFNNYSKEFKEEILNKYFNNQGSALSLSKEYNISVKTIETWIRKFKKPELYVSSGKLGRPKKDEEIDYKERYEILKKYQAFIKAQREKK